MGRLNIHIYPSQFKFESRILKITESLVSNGIVDQFVIIALPGPALPEWEKIDGNRIGMGDFAIGRTDKYDGITRQCCCGDDVLGN